MASRRAGVFTGGRRGLTAPGPAASCAARGVRGAAGPRVPRVGARLLRPAAGLFGARPGAAVFFRAAGAAFFLAGFPGFAVLRVERMLGKIIPYGRRQGVEQIIRGRREFYRAGRAAAKHCAQGPGADRAA